MKKLFNLLAVLLIGTSSFAETEGKIFGSILDGGNQKIVEGATVSLLTAKDSVLVKTAIADKEGNFSFDNVTHGGYLVLATSAGHSKTYSFLVIILEDRTIVNVGVLKLMPVEKSMAAVVVTSKKPIIEVKADKTIFNVESSITATGSNALEMLKKSPGVQVDNDDKISMNGKNGVKIYVDGKMLQLDDKNVAEYLKSITSSDMEAIEMITNPSAKYDAAGNAGIINIKLKKNKKFGTNGNASIGMVQGQTPKGNAAVSLNYRDKKINVFSNVSGNIGNHYQTINLNRIQSDTIFDMKSSQVSGDQTINAKAGLDYFVNKKNTLGFIANVNSTDHDWASEGSTFISYEPSMQLVKRLVAKNSVPEKKVNANFNGNYRYADTSGKEINIDADYGLFRSRSNSFQPNTYFDLNDNILSQAIYRNQTPIDIDIYSLKADAEQKLGKGKVGYGLKTSYVITQNAFDFYNASNGIDTKVAEKSNRFKFKENINAAYVTYQRQLNTKIDFQAGVRAEQTNSNGILTREDNVYQSDNNVKRSYLDIFPSASLSYKLNAKNSFGLSYSRRIDRPSYQDLNPFENKLDELTYQKGNAFLRPQYTDNIDVKHIFAGMLTTDFAYSYVRDFASEVLDTANKTATYLQTQNLATQQIFSWHISSPLPIKKWWNGYLEFWYNTMLFNGKLNNKEVDATVVNYGVYSTQSFNLGKDYNAELSGWWTSASNWGATGKSKPMGSVDMGIQKSFMQKKASVKISATDIFNTGSKWRISNTFGGLNLKGNGTQENRTFKISFNYRFGNSQVKSSRQRQTGLDAESSRIKG